MLHAHRLLLTEDIMEKAGTEDEEPVAVPNRSPWLFRQLKQLQLLHRLSLPELPNSDEDSEPVLAEFPVVDR